MTRPRRPSGTVRGACGSSRECSRRGWRYSGHDRQAEAHAKGRADMRGVTWTGDEVAVLRANLGLTDREIREAFLPNRSLASIGNQRSRISRDGLEYAVKSPGRYVETLADLLVDAWD